jgi:hypothetical protein
VAVSIHPASRDDWQGDHGMKKLANLSFYTAGLIFAVALSLLPTAAQAYVYDDFTNAGINPNLWVDVGPNSGLFSQPGDGYLYFNDSSGGQIDKLRSYNPVSGAFAVALQYSNFQVTNPGGPWQGSSVSLRVGDGNTYVEMMGWENSSNEGFQANYGAVGTWNVLNYVLTNSDSGWLKIFYNGILGPGGKVDFFYKTGAGWTKLGSLSTNFTQTPWFAIQGNNFYGQSLSFRVNQVQILTPNLAPTNMLLLESTH